ncbi:MAG TPA: cytochrome c3 family protein, partial [bacterium]|nr:cytochrome c3 family protein [bacterium]
MRQSLIVTGLILLVFATVIFLQSVNINRIGNHQGYAPEQPVEFSHRVHSNDLEIDCLYCHSGAEKSGVAGIP